MKDEVKIDRAHRLPWFICLVRCTTLNVLENPENVDLSLRFGEKDYSGNRLLLAKLITDSVATNPKRTFMQARLRVIFSRLLVAAAAIGLPRIVAAEAKDGSDRVGGQCDPIVLLLEFFDGVTPPALPTGWSSTTWVTSNSGVPTPPPIRYPMLRL